VVDILEDFELDGIGLHGHWSLALGCWPKIKSQRPTTVLPQCTTALKSCAMGEKNPDRTHDFSGPEVNN